MTVIDAIQELLWLREEQIDRLSPRQFHALEIARAILITLDPPQREMIDAILAMPDISSN